MYVTHWLEISLPPPSLYGVKGAENLVFLVFDSKNNQNSTSYNFVFPDFLMALIGRLETVTENRPLPASYNKSDFSSSKFRFFQILTSKFASNDIKTTELVYV